MFIFLFPLSLSVCLSVCLIVYSSVSSTVNAYPPAILKTQSVLALRSSPKTPKRQGRPPLPGYGYELVRRFHDALPYMEGRYATD